MALGVALAAREAEGVLASAVVAVEGPEASVVMGSVAVSVAAPVLGLPQQRSPPHMPGSYCHPQPSH